MKKTITTTMSATLATLFTFLVIGCSAPEIEEPTAQSAQTVESVKPETRQDLTIEQKRDRYNNYLATHPDAVVLMELIVQPGDFVVNMDILTSSSFVIIAWNSGLIFEDVAPNSTQFNGNLELQATFDSDDVIYMAGNPNNCLDATWFGLNKNTCSSLVSVYYNNRLANFVSFLDTPNLERVDFAPTANLDTFLMRNGRVEVLDFGDLQDFRSRGSLPSISPSIYLREIRVPADALPLIQGDLSGFPNLRKFTITLNSSTAVTLNLQEMTTVVSQLPVCRQGRGELYIRQGQQIMASTIAEANAKNWDVIRY